MYIYPPPHIGLIESPIKEVNIWEGDTIEWLWYHHVWGSYIYGYIVNRS